MTITHPQLVTALNKDGVQILNELTAPKCMVLHMAVGISGEAGELLDAIKKHTMYNTPLAKIMPDAQTLHDNIIEELGDIEFFLEGLRQVLGISREETQQANIRKLKKRYEGLVFSNEAAHVRADKTP